MEPVRSCVDAGRHLPLLMPAPVPRAGLRGGACLEEGDQDSSLMRRPRLEPHLLEEPMTRPSRRPRLVLRLCVALAATILTLAESSPPPVPVQAAGGHAAKATTACKPVKPKGIVKFSDWQFPANLNPYTVSSLVEAYVTNAMEETYWVYN